MTAPSSVPVDGHVHFYPCFDSCRFLDSAAQNFATAARKLGFSETSLGALLFTEISGADHFRRFATERQVEQGCRWKFEPTGEASSLLALQDDRPRLVLVAGRQIRTAEALEVLAIGCREDILDGQTLRETLTAVRRAGAIAVVPWGFGKWWLQRGRLISRLLQEATPDAFFLGDSGGRPRVAPRPVQFRQAEERGIRILPGTDPLPLVGEERRVGSYGFVVRTPIDLATPAESLQQCLRASAEPFEQYGQGASWATCLGRQLALRKQTRPPLR